MTSYFHACYVTVTNSNDKFFIIFNVLVPRHFEKGSATYGFTHLFSRLPQGNNRQKIEFICLVSRILVCDSCAGFLGKQFLNKALITNITL